MNKDHSDSLYLFATGLLGHMGEGWIIAGIDPEGMGFSSKINFARLDFHYLVSD